MYMNLKSLLATILLTLGVSTAEAESTKLTVHFFGSATCGECNQIKENLLKPLVAQNKEKFEYIFHDIETDSGLATILSFEKQFKVKTSSAQELFFPDTFLTGFEDIMKYGKKMITERLASGKYETIQIDSTAGNLTETLKKKAASWAFFLGTTGAGLVDGINPCAIATMIFLISFMTTKKRSPREIITIGLIYTATVFITYFAMGAGLKSILEGVKQYHTISLVIRWAAAGAAALIGILSFKDAFTFNKTKNTDAITLQLPKQVKLRIHKIISGNLSGRSLVVGAIITGFLVTLLEAICTGQMYVPFIVAMTSDDSLKTTGYLYLAYYNFLFVLPLLIVMVLAYYGMKWNELAKKTQNNMVRIKIGIGIVMIGLTIYLINGIL
jgi:cytochrome c biogenesis protein CcdA